MKKYLLRVRRLPSLSLLRLRRSQRATGSKATGLALAAVLACGVSSSALAACGSGTVSLASGGVDSQTCELTNNLQADGTLSVGTATGTTTAASTFKGTSAFYDPTSGNMVLLYGDATSGGVVEGDHKSGSTYTKTSVSINPYGGAVNIGSSGNTITVKGPLTIAPMTTPGLIGHTASGLAQSEPFATFQDFGMAGNADNDSTEDDTSALVTALQSGQPLLCSGKFRLKSVASVTMSANKDITVIGAGRQGCKIYEEANSGLKITWGDMDTPPFGNATNAVQMSGVTFVPDAAGTGNPALKLVGLADKSGQIEPSFFLDHVNVIPSSTSDFSDYGIWLQDVRNGTIQSSVIHGRYGGLQGATYKGATTYLVGSGVVFTSAGSANNDSSPVDLHFHDNIVAWWNRGLYLAPNQGGNTGPGNDWQGVYAEDNTFLANNYGIFADTKDNFAALLVARGNHINFGTVGIYTHNVQNPMLADNEFLSATSNNAPLGTQSWIGPMAANPDGTYGVAASTTYGIVFTMDGNAGTCTPTPCTPVAPSQFGKIHDNHFDFSASGQTFVMFPTFFVANRVPILATNTTGIMRSDFHDNSSDYSTAGSGNIVANSSYNPGGTQVHGVLNWSGVDPSGAPTGTLETGTSTTSPNNNVVNNNSAF